MFFSFSLTMILMFSFTFMFLSHPISAGLLILLQTLLIACFTGVSSHHCWFSYILFLVFLGGMLVLFSYMTSLVPNQTFKFSLFIYLFVLLSLQMTILLTPLMKILNWNFSSLSLFDPSRPYFIPFDHFNKLYLSNSSSMTIFLAIFLLLTLIVVVNMIKLNSGPLRALSSH